MPVDLSHAIGLPPRDAIAYLESKGYALGFGWQDIWQEANAKAFTAAGVMKADVLADLKGGLAEALKNGTSRADYVKNLQPILEKKGWWGSLSQTDRQTGEMAGKGLTPRRLATIFDTNMQTAYMAGRYKAFMGNVADRPYWQYVAIMDRRTRPSHAALNGRTFRYDDPIWQSHYPPNGFRCRCSVRALDEDNLKTRNIDLSSSQGKLSEIEVPTSRKPGAPMVTVKRFEYEPGKFFAPDPGWSYNPGAAWAKPFTPPPLDSLPKSFPQGVALPDMPAPSRVSASRLLPPGQPAQDYAQAFLGEFGADVGKPVVFTDISGEALVINEALFQDGAGRWKADKYGRGTFMPLLADTIKEPDEIWLRWEESRDRPGTWLLKRRYLKSFEMEGENGKTFGIGAFEWGKDGWEGSTVFYTNAKDEATRRLYLEQQRQGFLHYLRK